MPMQWNIKLFFAINRLSGKSRLLDAFGRAGAEWALPAMLGWLAVASFARYERNIEELAMIVTTLALTSVTGFIFSFIVAAIVREPRPYVRFPDQVTTLFRPLLGWKSFPSDHSLAAFLIVGVAYCFELPGILPLVIMALWIWFGRIYAGVHYPADILAGTVLGTLVLLVYALSGFSLVHEHISGLLRLFI